MHVVLVSPVTAYEPAKSGPYLGLAVLASYLRASGISCTCIDCNFLPTAYSLGLKNFDEHDEGKLLNECLSYIVSANPDVVGISAWGSSLPFAIVLSRALRKYLGDVPVIVGGLFYKPLADLLMQYSESIDAVVLGEGEAAFLDVLKRIRAKRGLEGLKGIVYRDNGGIRCEADMNILDSRAWGTPEFNFFVKPSESTYSFHYLEGSRGCTYNCIFCCIRGQGLRRKPARKLVEEMAALHEDEGVTRISMVDNFIPLQGSWIDGFCEGLMERQLAMEWSCCARADNISGATLQKMAKAGCSRLHFGIESVSQDTLGYINKAPDIRDYLSGLMRNVKAILDNGIGLQISVIIGFPYEGVGDMERTTEFAFHLQEMGVIAKISPVVVYPGSRMWDSYMEGKIELGKIKRPSLRTHLAGLFASEFREDPWITPNYFIPKHKFIEQEQFEEILSRCISPWTGWRK
jgi:radical SAM superfamily enzyme YgiQ (UPF0313 family)